MVEGENLSSFRRHQLIQLLFVQFYFRQYILQIRYGCVNPDCEQQSCYSYHLRTSAPNIPRRPTHLTARTIALALLDSYHPFSHLCRSGLNIQPGDVGLGSDSEVQQLLKYWLHAPLVHGIGVLQGANVNTPSSWGNLLPSTDEEKSSRWPARRQTLVPAPDEAVPFLRQLRQPAQRIDIAHLGQVLSASSIASDFEALSLWSLYRPNPWSEMSSWMTKQSAPLALPTRPILPSVAFRLGIDASIVNTYRQPVLVHDMVLSSQSPLRLAQARVPTFSLTPRANIVRRAAHISGSSSVVTGSLSLALKEYSESPLYPHLDSRTERSCDQPNRSTLRSVLNDEIFALFGSPDQIWHNFADDLWILQSGNGRIKTVLIELRQYTTSSTNALFNSLLHALNLLQTPHPNLRRRLREKNGEYADCALGTEYVCQRKAALVIILCICVVLSFYQTIPEYMMTAPRSPEAADWIKPHESPQTLRRLIEKVVYVVGVRRCFDEMYAKGIKNGDLPKINEPDEYPAVHSTCRIVGILIQWLKMVYFPYGPEMSWKAGNRYFTDEPQNFLVPTAIGIFHSCVSWYYNGETIINRWSLAGSALDTLQDFYSHREWISVQDQILEVPELIPQSRIKAFINSFFEWKWNNPNELHALAYGPLFGEIKSKVLFRSLNAFLMEKAAIKTLVNHYELSTLGQFQQSVFGYFDTLRGPPVYPDLILDPIKQKIGPMISTHLQISCRRDTLVQDAFNQLWCRTQDDLTKPLILQFGDGVDELGQDYGGISQEFFTQVFRHLVSSCWDMFAFTEERSGVVYFKACSETDIRIFELAGVLAGLAAHNACTIPISLPICLYMHLLGVRATCIEDIVNDWPALAEGLNKLLDWDEEAEGVTVENAFYRSYSFPVVKFYGVREVDIGEFKDVEWDGQSFAVDNDKIPMVTSKNRFSFVCDYIQWLTFRSVQPQLEAFKRGFGKPIGFLVDRPRVIDPYVLKMALEGDDASAEMLQSVTTYELPYHEEHETIKLFWEMVHEFDVGQLQSLTMFVTSSVRIPTSGRYTMDFKIVHSDCPAPDTRLPTSSTCSGNLFLPQYSSVEVMKHQFRKALENSVGFGIV